MSTPMSMWASGRTTLTVLAATAVMATAGAAGVASASTAPPPSAELWIVLTPGRDARWRRGPRAGPAGPAARDHDRPR
jgi:ABC-type sugar transport system substrate-binding protein